MKTLLTLERHSPGGRLLERRQGCSRSFVRGFMDTLYVLHSQAPYSSSFANAYDIWGGNRNHFDIGGASGGHYISSFLRVASAGGRCLIVGALDASNASYPNGSSESYLCGQQIGIAVGSDGTPVTPLDHSLKQHIMHGKAGTLAPGLIEDYSTGDNAGSNVYTGYSQTKGFFVPRRGYRCTGVAMKLYRNGSPGTCSLDLCRDGTNLVDTLIATKDFDGNALGTVSPGAMLSVAFDTPVDLLPGSLYYVRLHVPGGSGVNSVFYRYSSASPAVGNVDSSNNCAMFQASGEAGPELLYAGTTVENLTAADPNASLEIKRFFTNLSGEDVSVAEIGLYGVAGSGISVGPYIIAWPICLARDVVDPAVVVHNNELLLVTYTPQISV